MSHSDNLSARRWQYLVNLAFSLDEGAGLDADRREAACGAIESALEVFVSTVDPVSDFEGYAVRRLLLALQRSLRPE
jgi:hypothetical protein